MGGEHAPIPANTQPMTPDQIYAKYKTGVFQIFGRKAGVAEDQETTVIGTGFIHDLDGRMGITNAHVVRGLTALKARLSDGSTHPLHVMATDPCTDLAVVHISDEIPPETARLPLGDSDGMRPGQPVVVMGYPGSLAPDFTNQPLQITQGIVAASNVTASSDPGYPTLSHTIQHTAPVNPGNSGGPLFDNKGNVIGINTLANTTTGGDESRAIQGQYYSIGIKDAHAESDLLMQGKSQNDVGWTLSPSAYMSITDFYKAARLGPADAAVAYMAQQGISGGMWAEDVDAGSRPERKGLQPYDLIYRINNTPVRSMTEVCDIIESVLPQAPMTVSGLRFAAGREPMDFKIEFKMPGAHG